MHKLTVLVLGSNSLYITLNELKSFLKFNIINEDIDPSKIEEKKILFIKEWDGVMMRGQKIIIN